MSNDLLRDLFPPNQDYKVKHLKQKDQSKRNFNLEIEFRVNVKTECEVNEFVAILNQSTGCTFNIMRGKPDRRQSGGRTLSQFIVVSQRQNILK